MRARRPRPSEKTTARVIPGFSPLGHPCRAGPPAEGRAPHARKEGITPTPTLPRFGHRPLANSWVAMTCPVCVGPFLRTRRPRPSEKTAPAHSGGLIPQGRIPSAKPPAEGRAPHARKNCMTPTHMSPPFGHQPFARPSVIMTSPALRPARICGRAERVLPRKPPSTSSPALPPKGLYLKDPEWHNTGHLIGMTIG